MTQIDWEYIKRLQQEPKISPWLDKIDRDVERLMAERRAARTK